MLNYQINEGNIIDQSISDELGKMKNSFSEIQRLIDENGFMTHNVNQTIREKFGKLIQVKVRQLKSAFIQLADNPDNNGKEILSQACIETDAMKGVLTDLFNEIVIGGNGTFNELLDGEVSQTYFEFSKKKHTCTKSSDHILIPSPTEDARDTILIV